MSSLPIDEGWAVAAGGLLGIVSVRMVFTMTMIVDDR